MGAAASQPHRNRRHGFALNPPANSGQAVDFAIAFERAAREPWKLYSTSKAQPRLVEKDSRRPRSDSRDEMAMTAYTSPVEEWCTRSTSLRL